MAQPRPGTNAKAAQAAQSSAQPSQSQVEPPVAQPTSPTDVKRAAGIRAMAGRTRASGNEILNRDRNTNTPKRQREARSALIGGSMMVRAADIMDAHAKAIESGTVPPVLDPVATGLKFTKETYLKAARKSIDSRGYYDIHETDKWSDGGHASAALRELATSPEQRQRDETRAKSEALKAKEEALRFTKIPGFFPTPPALADEAVRKADIQPGMRVLEPEGGKGDLAQRAEAAGGKVDVAETQASLREILEAKGFTLVGRDMLEIQPPAEGPVYDRIVMNPPFENGQDREHVRHAYDLLKSGGRLVAIMSPGPFQRSTKADQAFKTWADSVGAVVEDNEAGSFAGKDAFRQTGVHTVTVTIDKPKEHAKSAEQDAAIVNLPLDKRGGGSLDKQIDRGLADERKRVQAVVSEANERGDGYRARVMALPLSAFESLAKKANVTPTQARKNLLTMPGEAAEKWLDERAASAAPASAPEPADGRLEAEAPEKLRKLDDPRRVRDITNGLYRLVNAVGDHGEVTVKPHFGDENDPVFRLDVSGKHGDGTTGETVDNETLRQAGIILGKNGRFDFDGLSEHLRRVNDAITGRKIKNDTLGRVNRNVELRNPGPNEKTQAVIPDTGEQVAYSQREEDARSAIVNLDAVNAGMKVGRVVAVADGWRFVAPNGRGIAIRSATADEARANEGRAEGYFTAVDANGEPAIVLIPGRTGPFTINHELVHHARRLGILTEGHIDALVRIGIKHGMGKWAPIYRAANPDMTAAQVQEEVAAKTVEAIKAGEIGIRPGWIQRVVDWFADLGRALAGTPKSDTRLAREVIEGAIFNGQAEVTGGEGDREAIHGKFPPRRPGVDEEPPLPKTNKVGFPVFGFRPSPAGSQNWGALSKAKAAEVGLSPMPIRVRNGTNSFGNRGFGYEHVDERHGSEIRGSGKSVDQFLADAIAEIGKAKLMRDGNDVLADVRPAGAHMVLRLVEREGGLDVVTARPLRANEQFSLNDEAGREPPATGDQRTSPRQSYTRGEAEADGTRPVVASSVDNLPQDDAESNPFSLADPGDPGDPSIPRTPQERLDAARQGVDPTKKPDDRPGMLAELRRHFKHLDPAKHAEAIAILRNLEAQLDGAAGQAERIMLGHVDGLTREQAEAFNDRLVLEDVTRQIEAGEFDSGPTEDGRTAEQIGEDIKRDIAKAIEKGGEPAAGAYEKRRTFQAKHTRALVEADLLDPAALDDPRYYHRQVLAHLMDKTSMGLGGSDARQRRRGFQKGRSGGTAADIPFYGDEEARRDFNANYAQAEFEYLAQSVQELARHDALERLDARYNQMRAAKAEAKARNRAEMDDAWVKENTVGATGERDEEAIGQGWDSHWRGLLAMNNASLADLAMADSFGGPFDDVWSALGDARKKWHGENDDLAPSERRPFTFDHPAWWKALAWLASHPEVTVSTEATGRSGATETVERKPGLHALAIFKAIAEREQHVKETLGKAYQTWRDVAQDMAGMTTWQPEEGLQLVPGWAATDQAIGTALRKAGLDEATVAEALPEKAPVGGALKRGLIVMGQKPQWLINEDLAKQLNSMRRVEDLTAMGRTMETWGRRWKLWMLHQPFRVVKYQLNNLVGDLDIALTQPGIMREVFKGRMQVARDLWAFTHGKTLDPKVEAQMKRAMESGILDSGVSAAELPDVDKLPALRALFGKQGWDMSWAGIPEAAKRYFGSAQRFGQWREAIMRVSAARAMYRQVSPEHRRYAASRKDELDQLYDRWQALSDQIDAIGRRSSPTAGDDGKVAEAEREIADLHATIAAKLARELIGDYGNLSHAGQWARRFLIPFWSWSEINAPRYVRLIRNARYEGGGGGARAAGAAAAMGAGLGVRMVALSAVVFAWNAMMKAVLSIRDDEDPNKDADLSKLVIILWRDEDGKIRGIRVAGALADALGWLDLDNSLQHAKALRDGFREGNTVRAGMETVGDILQAPVNKLAQGLTPVIKVPGEQVFRKTMFPDMFKPRPLGDRYGHLAEAMGVGSLYRAATDRTGWGSAFAGAMIVTHDPGSASAYRVRDDAEAWAQRNGKTIKSGGGTPKDQTNMLREAKSAFMRGEVERADRWLWKYYDLGGKPSFLGASKAAAHPLSILKKEDWDAYLEQLSPEKRAEFTKALGRWTDLWSGDGGLTIQADKAYQAWSAKARKAG